MSDATRSTFVQCAERIKVRWEQMHVEEAHLGHAAVGMWMFYWLASDQRTTLALLADGDDEALRRSAADYIEARFGELRGPALDAPAPDQEPLAFKA